MEKRIIDYTLLQGASEELIRLVKTKMNSGWAPLGGVAVAANTPALGRINCTYVQAMVKYGDIVQALVPPPLPASEPMIQCPHCNANIGLNSIKTGKNTCSECKGQFTAS